ncbi:hypothetical protein AWC38_SpisGene21155 [Stylophora pistillata]|uniref:Uncharacterized protein n=1 Tax=Stylophora pistillata TaxID=50429 RepID=A0A2B4R8J5_STYPI|nr:hypothetical protein AWC38_SpisGene21155 [Stylophora pistillata]
MSQPLLSLDTSVELGLLQLANTTNAEVKPPTENSAILNQDYPVTQLTSEFNNVFSGLGKHKRIKGKVIVDETVNPIAHKPRRILCNLAQIAAKEEQRLKELGVIETVPVDQSTTWCNNPVIAPKPDNLEAIRFCSQMKVPNTAILRPVTEALTGKTGADSFTVFGGNYRATPHPFTGKTLYELSMKRIVRTKLPSFTQVSPDIEVQQKDKDSKARTKAYADTKHSTKPQDLHIGNIALVKQKRSKKASPPFEPVPYTIRDIKGSMITASRSTDLKDVTLNSSHFKKLGSPHGYARAGCQYPCRPQQEPQAQVEFDDLEMHESSQPTSIQPGGELTNPEELSTNNNIPPSTVTIGQDPAKPPRQSYSGRRIQRQVWSKDYVLDSL